MASHTAHHVRSAEYGELRSKKERTLFWMHLLMHINIKLIENH